MGKVTLHVCDKCQVPFDAQNPRLEVRVIDQEKRTIDSGEFCEACLDRSFELELPIHRKMVGKAPAA
jgi:hypothetical protein